MEKRDSGYYQVAYINDKEKLAHRFDIVFGSGRKGQTYAYWINDYLFQLPVSYFTPSNTWVNSPNYPPHNVKFDRNIPSGCFECHSSYIKNTFTEEGDAWLINHFDKKEVVYGIDCERCHGPAARHVNFQEEHPLEKAPHFITAISTLPKQQQLDMCAMCHSGPLQTIRSTFGFAPGDTLASYIYPDMYTASTAEPDVHGRQYQLLSKSKCFIKSKALNCSSCHNTHIKERENLTLFSKRCINCHNTVNHTFCKMAAEPGENSRSNCIDCHMPAKPSRLITLLSQNNKEPVSALVRTHYISIYPEETKKFLTSANKKQLNFR